LVSKNTVKEQIKMLHDPLADVLACIKSYEKSGKNDCLVKPASKMIKETLQVMQKNGYIGSFEQIDDGKAGQFKIRLIGKINNCGVIKPRQPVKVSDIEGWEKKYLPAKNFGVILLSTSTHGIMTHDEAREKRTGGVLLAFVY